jgi:GNAT superfamily N-acetyltransferase
MTDPPGFTREERVAIESAAVFASVTGVAGATVMQSPEAPASPMLNRIVGLGVEAPATEAAVDEALAAVAAGVSFYVAVAPEARPADLPQWLGDRGLEPSWGWMSFRRGVEELPAPETALRLVEVRGPEDAAAFARVVRTSYGLPEAIEPRIAAARDRGWLCWVAYDGDDPAGAAGLYASDGVGYLGFAGTLPEHRGKGAQSALLSERIRRAAALGCDVLVTETGERSEGRPSNSYRNILRAGFTETAVTANWLGHRAPATG